MLSEDQVVAMLKEGSTFQQIADLAGRSREWVRVVAIRRDVQFLGKAVRKEQRKAAAENRLHKVYQAPMWLVRELEPIGALKAYTTQKANAAWRGIDWQFTAETWWKIWDESGRWSQRGALRHQYVMARHGDVGPYAPWNVYICTSSENHSVWRTTNRFLREEVPCHKIRAC